MPAADQLRGKLIAKLKELFQVDRADLDFGIYRILRQKHTDILEYLERRLPEKVRQELSRRDQADKDSLHAELAKAEQAARTLGEDPESLSKVRELRDRVASYGAGVNDDESELYSHLHTFFSRYYDKGDFLSRPRYKGNTYAIPYAGEEVKLHWANADQYYIKSSEYFKDYRFTLANGKTVLFKLVEAGTAVNNTKDKDRRFKLAVDHVVTRTNEDGEDAEESLPPVAVEGGELVIRFIYVPTEQKQDALCDAATVAILAFVGDDAAAEPFRELAEKRPTEKQLGRTLLDTKLADYTERNSSDYFIHKDLSGFLRRELDFYIKNEVMNLDDVQNVAEFAPIEKRLRLIQAMRTIARDLIDFLAQLEEFQKKLWLKKKFVVETGWCITLDRVPETLYAEIAANAAQRGEWVKLFAIDEIAPGSAGAPAGVSSGKSKTKKAKAAEGTPELGIVTGEETITAPGYSAPLTAAFIKANPYLVLDTKFFPAEFNARLLSSIDNLDEQTDGLLIHSENFQALNLLQERYREQVKCIYIDPPYNTDASAIVYKNGYKNSSWGCLMADRLSISKLLLNTSGVLAAAIDDVEFPILNMLINSCYSGSGGVTGVAAVRCNPAGRSTLRGFSVAHDYTIFASNSDTAKVGRLPRTEKQSARYGEKDEFGEFEWVNFRKHGGAEARREARPRMYYPFYVKNGEFRIPQMEWDEYSRNWNVIEKPCAHEEIILPKSPEGKDLRWKWGVESVQSHLSEFCVRPDQSGKNGIYLKSRVNEEGLLPLTWWDKKEYSATEYGTNLLKNLLGDVSLFSFPKALSLVQDCLRVCGVSQNDTALDFFGGSGTTGHATISLNREDGGKRKYLLVEMGGYFNTATKPRIQKVVYAKDWKDGKPVARDSGSSHCFKYLRLESYEDALNNLELQRSKQQDELFKSMTPELRDDYLLHYMLDVEARGSLLSTGVFKKPFDYKLAIATGNAGESRPERIDLVETFNYLIGLRVKHLDWQIARGYLLMKGRTPANERALVIWRDCDKVGYAELEALCATLKINPRDLEYDVIYVNGDHTIANTITTLASEGEATLTFKVRLIEDEFMARMWAAADGKVGR